MQMMQWVSVLALTMYVQSEPPCSPYNLHISSMSRTRQPASCNNHYDSTSNSFLQCSFLQCVSQSYTCSNNHRTLALPNQIHLNRSLTLLFITNQFLRFASRLMLLGASLSSSVLYVVEDWCCHPYIYILYRWFWWWHCSGSICSMFTICDQIMQILAFMKDCITECSLPPSLHCVTLHSAIYKTVQTSNFNRTKIIQHSLFHVNCSSPKLCQ